MHLVDVLVDAPTEERFFTYSWEGEISAGDGVWVPLGPRLIGGIVVQVRDFEPQLFPVKSLNAVLQRGLLPAAYWKLLLQVADYYQTSLRQVVQTALPSGLLTHSQRRIVRLEGNPTQVSPRALALWEQLGGYRQKEAAWRTLRTDFAEIQLRELERAGLAKSYLYQAPLAQPKQETWLTLLAPLAAGGSPRQQQLLTLLQRLGGTVPLSKFLTEAKTTRPSVQKLADQGWIALEAQERLRLGTQPLPAADQPKILTPEQALALNQIQALGFGQTLLLWGVTGSGKTEVYLQAIAPVLTAGKSALVLVPEIGLTPQLTERFQRRFGSKVWVYHSALSVGERFDSWRQMSRGEPLVVIGTRSAVFAPLPNLGLILLDEEHDPSYKQDRPAPCYHARTVAQWRAQMTPCPLVLGTATPALETYHQAQTGDYALARLPERVGGAQPPTIQLVDMREELASGVFSPLSRLLQKAIGRMVERGEQGILFLNRRGFHTFVMCRACGAVLTCPHCDVSLTYHLQERLLRCHHCHHQQPEPNSRCPQCASPHLRYFGTGTQRIEAAVQALFPDLKILRFDRDTTQKKGAHQRILDSFSRGEADLLLGTQMLTKGLDIPQVTLVGILAADSLLNLPDFRCSERALQLLTQVIGRSGRGSSPGEVILQTYNPDHPVVQAAQAQNYQSFLESEYQERQALHYPPFGKLVAFGWQGRHEEIVIACAQQWAQQLLAVGGQVLGPAPALIPKVRQEYRWQLLWKLDQPPQPLLKGLEQHLPPGISRRLDIDPIQFW